MKAIKYDKLMHFAVGAVIAMIGAFLGSFLWWLLELPLWIVPMLAGILPLLAGVIKELRDMKQPNNRFDYKDMFATWIGGGLIFLLVLFATAF